MNRKKTKRKVGKVAVSTALVTALAVGALGGSVMSVYAGTLSNEGKFYSDYTTYASAQEAADELNRELSREGNVLLKNENNALPMNGKEKLSVFGVRQDSLTGGTGSIAASLTKAGFIVNPILNDVYAANNSGIGSELTTFAKSVENSLELYNDGAVILLSRTGGEGADAKTVTTEAADGKHENQPTGKKHYLELTNSELDLITYVKKHFKKVHLIINTSNAMELGDLQDDEAIKSILWIGRPGATGVDAVGEIYNGTVNPSGSMVDEWMRDFTTDPTWFNFGDNTQTQTQNLYFYPDGTPTGTEGSTMSGGVGYHGIDYEEDIYLGYKYYETRYAELYKTNPTNAKTWWGNNVVYPFGYGLSFTSFNFDIQGVYTDEDLETSLGNTVAASKFNSGTNATGDNVAEVEKLYIPVNVTNTGAYAGKKTVQIYVTAPYTVGEVEKSAVTMVGFAKSDILKPGQTQTVVVSVNVQDFASYDAKDLNGNGNKGYELDEGEYIIRAMDTSHVDLAKADENAASTKAAYDHYKFTLEADAKLKLDDFSHAKIENLFSAENGHYYSIREGINNDSSVKMTQMTRAEGLATLPEEPSIADRTVSQNFVDWVLEMELFDADDKTYTYKEDGQDKTLVGADYITKYDKASSQTAEEWAGVTIPTGWTQAETTKDGLNETLLRDMAGVAYDDAKWTAFMNQLSWAEIVDIVSHGSYLTQAIPSIDKTVGADKDGPNNLNSTHSWCDESVIGATFNTELAKRQGIVVANLAMLKGGITGWYGPGMNIDRSPFSGRNNEYYSQDGILAGYIAAAVVSGAESRGLNTYSKHFLLNDQETNRNGDNCFTWVSEQAFRENYLKSFQMAMQEGGATAAMSAFSRIGKVATACNYNLLTALCRDEWGWNGYFVTDMFAGESRVTPVDLMIRTGNDLPLGTPTTANVMVKYKTTTNTDGTTTSTNISVSADRTCSGTWDKTLRNNKGGVVVGTANTESAEQYYYARVCAQRVLYGAANSINNRNGTQLSSYTGKTDITATQGTAVSNISVAIEASKLNGATPTYTIASGALPAGLSLNANTGAITGTPTEAGTYNFSVKVSADNWISATASFRITVASGFTCDVEQAYNVGEEMGVYIESDTINTDNGYNSVVYTVKEGTLPAGVTLAEDGLISGTPTAAGVYKFTVNVAATTGSGNRATTTNYSYEVTLVVTGEGAVAEEGKTIVSVTPTEDEDGYVVEFSDGTSITLNNGKDGADGADGAAGKNGANGTNGADGKDGVDGKDGGGCNGSIVTGCSMIAGLVLVAGALIAVKAFKKKKND